MIDWSNPNQVGGMLGATLGLIGALGGIWGACLGTFAPRGMFKGPIFATGYLFTAFGVGCVIAGIVCYFNDAILGLWLPLLLVGLNFAALFPILIFLVAKKRYAEYEERIMSAESLRRE